MQKVRKRQCQDFQSLFAIQTPTPDLYEQDLSVVSAIKEQFDDTEILKKNQATKSAVINHPKEYDRDDKFKYYRQISSLQEYVLVDSESKSVEIYQRGEGRMWLYSAYIEGEKFTLSSIEFNCAVDILYEGISFETVPE